MPATLLILLSSFLGALILLVLWAAARQHRHLRELHRRDALFGAFFEASPTGLAVLNRDLRYVRVNTTRAQMDGSLPGAFEGRHLTDTSPGYADFAAKCMNDVVIHERVIANFGIDGCGPDGKAHWLVSWFPLYQGSGRTPSGIGEVILDITQRRQAEIALTESREKLRALAAHREGQREQEYRHLAREFHDELGQILTTARLHLQRLAKSVPQDAAETVTDLDHLLGDAYRSVKDLAAGLRPPALNLGLAAAIEWQAQRALTPAGISFTSSFADAVTTLTDEQNTVLFRIVQEAMTNAARYAAATQLHVSLRLEAHELIMTIADDGCGFNPSLVDSTSRFGLAGMAERAYAIGGNLDIDSAPGEGTRITVRIAKLGAEPT